MTTKSVVAQTKGVLSWYTRMRLQAGISVVAWGLRILARTEGVDNIHVNWKRPEDDPS